MERRAQQTVWREIGQIRPFVAGLANGANQREASMGETLHSWNRRLGHLRTALDVDTLEASTSRTVPANFRSSGRYMEGWKSRVPPERLGIAHGSRPPPSIGLRRLRTTAGAVPAWKERDSGCLLHTRARENGSESLVRKRVLQKLEPSLRAMLEGDRRHRLLTATDSFQTWQWTHPLRRKSKVLWAWPEAVHRILACGQCRQWRHSLRPHQAPSSPKGF